MKLALVVSLPVLELLMDAYVAERGDADDCQLLRQLTLSDFIEWVKQQQREEIANGKTNRAGSADNCAVPGITRR